MPSFESVLDTTRRVVGLAREEKFDIPCDTAADESFIDDDLLHRVAQALSFYYRRLIRPNRTFMTVDCMARLVHQQVSPPTS